MKSRKIKNVLTSMIMAMILPSLVGCSGSVNNSDTKSEAVQDTSKADIKSEAVQNTSKADTKSEAVQDTSKADIKDDIAQENEVATGVYGANLLASDKDKIDTTNEVGLLYEIVYDAYIEGNELIAYGAMDYRNFKEQDPITISSDLKHIFIIDENTTYQMLGGMDGAEVISKEEFNNYLKELIDSGLFLEIEVSDGVVTTASIIS